MMIRSFLPVGQGAFYCERFRGRKAEEDVIVIYDCGSSTDVELVEEQIKSKFYKGQTIHAVFISHLDDDHINGLPFLLKYCHVKKMFFPLITEENAIYMSLLNIIHNRGRESFASFFARNPYDAFNQLGIMELPKFYQIAERDQNRDSQIDATVIPSGENVANRIWNNSVYNSLPYREWKFIPYNFRQEDRIRNLQRALKKCFGQNMNNINLQLIWEKGSVTERNRIKWCYQQIKGSFNTNSMTLYSGTEKKITTQYVVQGVNATCYNPCCCGQKMAGCLYMGDYDAAGTYKWEKLHQAYDTYWDKIGCIQIPHHGSKHNYNPKLAELDAYYVMSAGKKNKYNHPNSVVIKDLVYNRHFPYIVTEENYSELQLRV